MPGLLDCDLEAELLSDWHVPARLVKDRANALQDLLVV
jgi:hypothetical protein